MTALTEITNPGLVASLLDRDTAAVQARLADATLLAAASSAGASDTAVIRTGRGSAGRALVWAFTDAEALAAWDRHPADHAAVIGGAALSSLRAIVALNAAGPGCMVLDGSPAAESRAADGREPATPDLADAAARRPLRKLAGEAHDLGRRAAAAGQLEEACGQLERSVEVCKQLGDELHGAAASLELAAARERSGSVGLALPIWEIAAQTLARLGEGDLALAALLDAAESALAAGLPEDAERLGLAAIELCAGSEAGDRLVSIWGRLNGS